MYEKNTGSLCSSRSSSRKFACRRQVRFWGGITTSGATFAGDSGGSNAGLCPGSSRLL
jgi:hypothetical protein